MNILRKVKRKLKMNAKMQTASDPIIDTCLLKRLSNKIELQHEIEKSGDLPTRICIVDDQGWDRRDIADVVNAAYSFSVPVVIASKKEDNVDLLDDNYDTIYVFQEFSGPAFEKLTTTRRILGPTALIELSAGQDRLLLNNDRPLYSLSMVGVRTCFTGFKDKEELKRLRWKVHCMGASVLPRVQPATTHLIANSVTSHSYRRAVVGGVPVMAREWVDVCWDRRHEANLKAASEEMMIYTAKILLNVWICCYGLSPEIEKETIHIIVHNGGTVVKLHDPRVTHVVVDESVDYGAQFDNVSTKYIVSLSWLLKSLEQNLLAVEEDFLIKNKLAKSKPSFDLSSPKYSIRRQRPQSVRACPGLQPTPIEATEAELEGEAASESLSAAEGRSVVFKELLHTEQNYVSILDAILKVRDDVLMPDPPRGPILDSIEARIIFGNIESLFNIHNAMLERLKLVDTNWTEEALIGEIFVKFCPEFQKEYPVFVNFFETSRKTLLKCDASKPRFHAFLQVCQAKPNFHRQSLQELMIRPVQRLASTVLILNELLKRTNTNSPDKAALKLALKEINDTVSIINEEKKKSEILSKLFDIFNMIIGCPASLLSSNRSFVFDFEAIELTNKPGFSKIGDHLVLLVFADRMVVCKTRKKVVYLEGLASVDQLAAETKGQPYKYREDLELRFIWKVVDIIDCENVTNAISLHVCGKRKREYDENEEAANEQTTHGKSANGRPGKKSRDQGKPANRGPSKSPLHGDCPSAAYAAESATPGASEASSAAEGGTCCNHDDCGSEAFALQLFGDAEAKADLLRMFVGQILKNTAGYGASSQEEILQVSTAEQEGVDASKRASRNPLHRAVSLACKGSFKVGSALGLHKTSSSSLKADPGGRSVHSSEIMPTYGSEPIVMSQASTGDGRRKEKCSSLTTALMKRL